MSDSTAPEEFTPHVAEAPSDVALATRPRPTVAAMGGLPASPAGKIKPGQATKAVRPVATERASDGTAHVQEAAIFSPEPHGASELLAMAVNVEHKCGHIESVRVWRDETKRKAQIARIEKNGTCYRCATGKKS